MDKNRNTLFIVFVSISIAVCCVFVGGCRHAFISIAEPIYNYGTVSQHSIVTNTFIIKNESINPVQVIQVRKTCGCTYATVYPDTRIIPGLGEGLISVGVETRSRYGNYTAPVYVTFQDARSNITIRTLYMKGTIEQHYRVSPKRHSKPRLFMGTIWTDSFIISTVSQKPFSILKDKVKVRKGISLSYTPNAERNEYTITFTINADEASSTEYQDDPAIVIVTDYEPQTEIILPLTFSVIEKPHHKAKHISQ